MERLDSIFPIDILEKYEIYNYYHAAEIMCMSYPEEFNDLIHDLRNVHISMDDVLASGGNESSIPPKFKEILFPKGWAETRILKTVFHSSAENTVFLEIKHLRRLTFIRFLYCLCFFILCPFIPVFFLYMI